MATPIGIPSGETPVKPPVKIVTPTPVAAKPVVKKPPVSGITSDDPYGGLVGTDRDAAVALNNIFTSYGIGTLASTIVKYIQDGYSSDTISILLQDTPEYKKRFAANAVRLKNGLPVLSPAEYISTENSYRQVMQAAGLPIGYYDKSSDFEKFLELDVAPTEVQDRVNEVSEALNNAPADTVNYFKQFGYTNGDMIAYALDPTVAKPLIDQRLKAAEAAAISGQSGNTLSQANAELIGRTGASLSDITSGLNTVNQDLGTATQLGQIYGVDETQDDLVKEVFAGDASAAKKRAKLASQERATFGGNSAQGKGTLTRTDAGSI